MLNIPTFAQVPALSYHCVIDADGFSNRLKNLIVDGLRGRGCRSGKAAFIVDMLLHNAGVMRENDVLLRKRPILRNSWHRVLGVRNDLVDDAVIAQMYAVQDAVGAQAFYNPVGQRWCQGYMLVPGGSARSLRHLIDLTANPKYAEAVQPLIDGVLGGETLHAHLAGGSKKLVDQTTSENLVLPEYNDRVNTANMLNGRNLPQREPVPQTVTYQAVVTSTDIFQTYPTSSTTSGTPFGEVGYFTAA